MILTKLVAILNITPDSFSDGGVFLDPVHVKEQIESLLELNSEIIDIGAISTRPNSIQPTIAEEIERYNNVLPMIAPILRNSKVKLSVDSYNFETIEYLSKHIPIHWINDQKGFTDPKIIDFAKKIDASLVIMHQLSIPANPHAHIDINLNVVDEVKKWLLNKVKYLLDQGISPNKIILDPGIGFGKTHKQSWQLIKHADHFTNLGFKVMFGHSRKSYLNLITNKDFKDRDLETSIVSSYLAGHNIDYLRVHNVETSLQAVKIAQILREKNG